MPRQRAQVSAGLELAMLIPQVTPIQPVNVVVQMPPGAPIWLTIVLSGSIGAISAILGGLAVEYLKPYIARRQREKMIRGLVDDEFLANLGELEACLRVLKHAFPGTVDQKAHSVMVVDEIMHRVIQDRYDLYFEQDKEIVWAIDKKRLLWSFYEALSRKPEDVTLSSEHIEIELWIDRVVRRGKSYLEEAELLYEPGENPNEQIYYELDAAEKRGRAEGLKKMGMEEGA
jgi:hypothetical protein